MFGNKKRKRKGMEREQVKKRGRNRLQQQPQVTPTPLGGKEPQAKEEKPRSTWSWVFEFADMRKRDYVLSIAFAVCKVICIVAPYVVLADVASDFPVASVSVFP